MPVAGLQVMLSPGPEVDDQSSDRELAAPPKERCWQRTGNRRSWGQLQIREGKHIIGRSRYVHENKPLSELNSHWFVRGWFPLNETL